MRILRTGSIVSMASLAALAACTRSDFYRKPRNVLEQSLGFREIARDSEPQPIGGEGKVPSPATVDIESVIEISIDKDQLRGDTPIDRAPLGELEAQAKLLTKTADLTLQCIQGEQALLRRFAELDGVSPDAQEMRAFLDSVKANDDKETAVIETIRALYDRRKQDAIAARMEGRRGLLAIHEFLRDEIAALEQRQREVTSQLEATGYTLRMSAYLHSPSREGVSIRLCGYDSLPDGHFVPVSRSGLPLNAEDRAALQKAWQATVDLSRAMQRVAEGDAQLRELLLATAPQLSKQLGELLRDVDALVTEAESPAFRAALQRIQADLPRLFERLGQEAAAAGEAVTRRIAALQAEDAAVGALAGLLGIDGLVPLVARGKQLAERWKRARPADFLDLGLDSMALAAALRELPRRVGELELQERLVARLEAALASVAADLKQRVLAVATDEFRDALAALELVRGFAERAIPVAKQAFNAVADVFEGKKSAAQPRPHPPESFEVPLEDAVGTFVELQSLPRRDGDLVRLRTTISRGGKVLHEGEAGFRVATFGWRGRLSPSVVLARPNEIAGEETFQFAPVLSWLHGYHARPTEGGCFVGVNRLLQPALGIHAGFLNFDPDEEVEIGLGGTLSLWEGRLQFGAGCNLMAEAEDQGRYYWFVGSDLISLLQTIGLAEP